MILCIALSPALDVTYRVARLAPGETHRVTSVTQRPGGKAVNVARILTQLGTPARVLAPVGGPDGDQFASDLCQLEIAATLTPSGPPTRRTLTVVDELAAEATVFSEPAVIDCWDELLRSADAEIPAAAAIVVSGTLPVGAPGNGIALLVERCHAHGRPVLVDSSGHALRHGLDAKPTLVKPNAEELRHITEHPDVAEAATDLAATAGTVVVASLGPEGVIAASPSGTWSVRPGAALVGNPTGAGDALVAGLARALAGGGDLQGVDLPTFVADGVALSAASVLSPVAGEVDLEAYSEQSRTVVVTELAVQR
ncbi:tagatose 6-phosphate kinase [Frankineae bacterium MT45]|nr:tagatose 6-phosphate kinase [Frankineae bacterium MT45]